MHRGHSVCSIIRVMNIEDIRLFFLQGEIFREKRNSFRKPLSLIPWLAETSIFSFLKIRNRHDECFRRGVLLRRLINGRHTVPHRYLIRQKENQRMHRQAFYLLLNLPKNGFCLPKELPCPFRVYCLPGKRKKNAIKRLLIRGKEPFPFSLFSRVNRDIFFHFLHPLLAKHEKRDGSFPLSFFY